MKDDSERSPRSLRLLERAERREIQLYLTELVIAELVWILQSTKYGFPRNAIRDLLMRIIELPGVRIANKSLYNEIFALYAEAKIDYIDAYNAVVVRSVGLSEVYSYDSDFDRIAGLKRLEP